MKTPVNRASRKLALISIAVGLAALVAVTTTIDDIGLNGDEPNYYDSCLHQIAWFGQAARDFSAGRWSAPFEPGVIDRYWNIQLIYNVHPPFYKLCSSLTLALFERWLGPVVAYRLSPAIMFCLLAGLLCWTVGRRYGTSAGLWASIGFALMPRVFGHAHFGCPDMPLSLLWFASAVCFHRALKSRRWALVFALVYGLALATKFTALAIPLPLILYLLLNRRFKHAAWPLGLALVISPVVMIGLNPQWWHHTLERLYVYLADSATRSRYLGIPTLYLGRQYYFHLPWYHPLALTLFTVSPLVLASFLYGFWHTVRRPFADRWATHMLLHWLVIMFVMALPSSPGHDGVRLFLPAFAFLSVISARGFQYFVSRTLPWIIARTPRLKLQKRAELFSAWLILALMTAPAAASLARVHPNELCYYNCLTGGIRGAHALGMESTSMWEVFNGPACELIGRAVPDSSGILAVNNRHFFFLQKMGKIKSSLRFVTEDFDYILQYCSLGMFTDLDRVLYNLGTPVAEHRVDDVRLFALYRYPAVFEEILSGLERSKSTQSMYQRAVVYQATARPNRAYYALEEYLEHCPGDFEANMRMAGYFMGRGFPDRAIERLERIGDTGKDPKMWHYNMGLAYLRSGEKERAEASFSRALESRSPHSSPMLIDAEIYYEMGRLEESARLYALLLRSHRNDETACQMLGIINHRLGKTGEAKHYYLRLLQIQPGHFETLYNMGLLEGEQGNLTQSAEYYTRALEVDSSSTAAHFQLAKLLAETGETKRALEHFRTLARLEPGQAGHIEETYIQPLRAGIKQSHRQ
ncbi:MAG: tetratricopeptide repeat protein [Gemmatimonadota bacterium]|nr:tetratricopeptide repeat protein [Gemmatimonadota bacterium]